MSSSKTIQVPKVIPNDWTRLRIIIDKLKYNRLGGGSTPVFAGVVLTGLTAERLVWSDANKALASKDLIDLVAGTANRVTVADDGSGGVIATTPQDTHEDAHMELAGLTIKDSGDNIIFYVDDDEMYFTASAAVEIADGMCIGLALALTYKT
jgi:hypothetical protein